jgi:hypothetical protein
MLQDSTRYEKTAKLLEKFDPDYVPPTPGKQLQQQALRKAFIPGTPGAPRSQAVIQFLATAQHTGKEHQKC